MYLGGWFVAINMSLLRSEELSKLHFKLEHRWQIEMI